MRLLPVILAAALGSRGRAAIDLALLVAAVPFGVADAIGAAFDRRARARAAGDESAVCDFDPLDPCEHAEIAAMRETIRLARADAEWCREDWLRDVEGERRAEAVIAWARDRIREIEDAYRTEPLPVPAPDNEEPIHYWPRGDEPMCGDEHAQPINSTSAHWEVTCEACLDVMRDEDAHPEPRTSLPVKPGVLASTWVHYWPIAGNPAVICGPWIEPGLTNWSDDRAQVTCPNCLKALADDGDGEEHGAADARTLAGLPPQEAAIGDRYMHADRPGEVFELLARDPDGEPAEKFCARSSGGPWMWATAAELAAPPWQRIDDAPPTPQTHGNPRSMMQAGVELLAGDVEWTHYRRVGNGSEPTACGLVGVVVAGERLSVTDAPTAVSCPDCRRALAPAMLSEEDTEGVPAPPFGCPVPGCDSGEGVLADVGVCRQCAGRGGES